MGPILFAAAQILGHQRGGGDGKAEDRHIADGFAGIGQLVSCQRDCAQAGDQSCADDLPHGDGGPLQQTGNTQRDRLADDHRPGAKAFGKVDLRWDFPAEEHQQHAPAGKGCGQRRGGCRAGNAPACAGHGEGKIEDRDLPGGVDQQKIADHID